MNQKTAIKQLKLLQKDIKNMRLAAESWKTPFQTLVSTIMSARTRDEVTIVVADKLFRKYPSPNKLATAKLKDIKEIIRPVNFYKNKAKNIIECSKKIVRLHGGKVPSNIEELIALPGVGRKTANVFISEYGEPGIAVDTHVHYISNYLGWSRNKNPHKVEEELKKLFPKKIWNKVNPTLVRFGKTHTSRKERDKLLEEIKK
ncbi:endonuclease III [Candidatus Woesearchaeota archaeon CG10_big_fil_rev_8_21_14_0_10_34_12]|nr:MAG: endonuclease III [Candidatus Woesearchaeota archaeon CG10_big_fil_rev_8_21_14_0_10_34_12]